ncbi:pyruvate kinase alpha/beta domain-containing protein [Geminocystis sp.]|uniref:pyruvate kinase alpha/beta domain-containing protein n=1 Tax=Geminocystis sp. TaxID=2664100 RepID=UPI0035939F98
MFRPALWTLYHFFIFDNLTPLSKNHTLIQQRQKVYHRLNLIWGVKPILIPNDPVNFEELVAEAERIIKQRNLGKSGDKILIMAGIPTGKSQGTNFLKIHQID